MSDYVTPLTVDEALDHLSNGKYQVLAGGTDIYPAYVGLPISSPMLDVVSIEAMKGISFVNNEWRIGGATSWRDIEMSSLPRAFDGLKLAAREVGARQIQNAATVAGNLCNASPAADGVPPLLTLDAKVELSSVTGVRQMALSDFILGNRQTNLREGELLTAILIPNINETAVGHFLKLGSRSHLVISIVMVATLVDVDGDGLITDARLCVGACSAVAKRLDDLEAALVGVPLADIPDFIDVKYFEGLSPIDDIRATAAYRRQAAREMIERSLENCAGRVKS